MKSFENKTKPELIEEIKNLKNRVEELELSGLNIIPGGRNKSLEGLIKSEEQFRKYYMEAPLGYQSLDENGCFLDVNEVWLETLGYERSEIIGKSFADFLAPGFDEHFRENFPRFKKAGKIDDVEFKMRHKSGVYIDVSFNGRIAYNKEGKFSRTHCILKDITKSKKVLNELEMREYYLKKAQEIGSIGTWEMDIAKNELLWTEENYRIFGISIGTDLTFETFINCVHPDDREYVNREWTKALKTKLYDIEHRLLIDGKVKWVREKADLIFDEQGNSIKAVGVTQDFTERKEIEKALIESEERYRGLFENSRDAICVFSKDRRIIRANRQLLKLSGFTTNELLSMKKETIFPEFLGNESKERIHSLLSGEDISTFETYLLSKHNKKIPVEIGMSIVKKYCGEEIVFQGNIRDITERKQVEKAIKEQVQRNEAILGAVPDIIMEVDGNKKYTWANKPGVDFFGDDVISKEAIFYFEGEQETYKSVKPLFNGTSDVIYVESWQRRKDGEKRLLAWWCRVRKDSEGNVLGALSTARDITDQKQAEIKLAVSDSKMRSIFRAAPVGIGVVVDRVITQVNDRFCDMLGYNIEELIGKGSDFLYPSKEEFEWVGREKYIQIADKGTGTVETRLKRKDGKVLNILLSSTPMEPEDLSKGVTFTALDITDRKIAAEEVKKQKEYYQTVFSNLHEDIFIIDKDYIVTDVNHAIVHTSGIPRNEIIGKHCYETSHSYKTPCDLSGEECLLKQVFKDGKPKNYKHIHSHKDGKEVHIDILMSPILDENGNISHVIEAMRDITDLISMQEALKESEEKYRKFFEDDITGDYLLSSHGTLIDCNSSYMNIFGFSSFEEASDFCEKEKKNKRQFINKVKQYGKLDKYEYEAQKKDGQFLSLLENAVAEFDDNGKLSNIRGYLMDVTEEKKAKKEIDKYQIHLERLVSQRTEKLSKKNNELSLEVAKRKTAELDAKKAYQNEKEVNELKTRFISTVSHEIRTPLTTIKSSAELIKRYKDKFSAQEQVEHFDRIINSVDYLVDLVEDVLSMSRSDSGKVIFSPETVNIENLFLSIVEKIKRTDNSNHPIKFVYKGIKKSIISDSKLLSVTLTNLLNNAIKYSDKGIEIKVNVIVKNSIVLEVIDYGIGIPDEGIRHLFEPFYRAGNVEKYKGSGLGLSIVMKSVELLKGTIQVESKINEGSKFIIRIPIKN